MARITPAKVNFNGGEISKRLQGRIDLTITEIACASLVGFGPLVEGGLEACPGTIVVAEAAGPFRPIPFKFSVTQEYVIEASNGLARFYTNDARIEDEGDPVELVLPYDFAAIERLTWAQSFDVLYLFHGEHQTRQLVRNDADDFALELLELENGPFEARNKDKTLTVSASAVVGTVTLTASADLFEAGDVGGLFQLEADDFGDITAWEPGITVTNGQLLTWGERVYQVVGGSLRTGTLAPVHVEGVEWDGIGSGEDINEKDAGGVQLEYLHDRFGMLKITAFTNSTEVTATVLKRLPFTASGTYTGGGGYYWDPEDPFGTPPPGAVTYGYGTWRWRFGAFSERRGWPSGGTVWGERLILFKESTVYGSVAGDLTDFSTYNELGEVTPDEAFITTVEDPNGILSAISDDDLILLTASGPFVLRPRNPAASLGPGNVRAVRQNNEGSIPQMPVELDGRFLYINDSARRVIEASYSSDRDRQTPIDLTRYARHIGKPGFVGLVAQQDPNRLIWAVMGDGTLALAAYHPEEKVLGWARRELAPGVLARGIAEIHDPAGELNQVWLAVEYEDSWWMVRMAQWREEGDPDPVMTDMAAQYEGEPATSFGPVAWLAGKTCQVQADDRLYLSVPVDGDGMFTLPTAASEVTVGLAYPSEFESLDLEGGSDNGAARGKMRRIGRTSVELYASRGLELSVQGSPWRPFEELTGSSETDSAFAAFTGVKIAEDMGDFKRTATVKIRRRAPAAATVMGFIPTVEVQAR